MPKCKCLLFISFSLFLFSCENKKKDTQFCECLKISKQLNDKNQQLLTDPKKRDSLIGELSQIIAEKRRICKPYANMPGDEMMDRGKACE